MTVWQLVVAIGYWWLSFSFPSFARRNTEKVYVFFHKYKSLVLLRRCGEMEITHTREQIWPFVLSCVCACGVWKIKIKNCTQFNSGMLVGMFIGLSEVHFFLLFFTAFEKNNSLAVKCMLKDNHIVSFLKPNSICYYCSSNPHGSDKNIEKKQTQ